MKPVVLSDYDRHGIRQRGGGDVARAIRSYVANGAQYCDVVIPDSGRVWNHCAVLATVGAPIGAPTEPYTGDKPITSYPLVALLYRSHNRSPIVLGRVESGTFAYGAPIKDGEYADQQHPESHPQLRDAIISLGSSRIVLRDNGSVSLVASGAMDVRAAGGLTLTQSGGGDGGGANTDERLAMVGPLGDYLDDVAGKIAGLQEWATRVSSVLKAIAATVGIPVTGVDYPSPGDVRTMPVAEVDRPTISSKMIAVSSDADT